MNLYAIRIGIPEYVYFSGAAVPVLGTVSQKEFADMIASQKGAKTLVVFLENGVSRRFFKPSWFFLQLNIHYSLAYNPGFHVQKFPHVQVVFCTYATGTPEKLYRLC